MQPLSHQHQVRVTRVPRNDQRSLTSLQGFLSSAGDVAQLAASVPWRQWHPCTVRQQVQPLPHRCLRCVFCQSHPLNRNGRSILSGHHLCALAGAGACKAYFGTKANPQLFPCTIVAAATSDAQLVCDTALEGDGSVLQLTLDSLGQIATSNDTLTYLTSPVVYSVSGQRCSAAKLHLDQSIHDCCQRKGARRMGWER